MLPFDAVANALLSDAIAALLLMTGFLERADNRAADWSNPNPNVFNAGPNRVSWSAKVATGDPCRL